MQADNFSTRVNHHLIEGQQTMANTLRQLVYKMAPEWFERMNFDCDRTFLHPALFAWFTAEQPVTPLEQILFGLVERDCRPAQVRVATDDYGRTYLPNLGIVQVGIPNASLILHQDQEGFRVCMGSDRRRVVFEPQQRLPAHRIDIDWYVSPLFHRFFEMDRYPPQAVPHLQYQTRSIQKALNLMAGLDVELYQWITELTQVVQLYRAEQPNSFATLSAHGTAFLNVNGESDVVFFIDDLSHQCGHIIFNAVTLDKRAFLTRDAETPLRHITEQVDETRSLYSAFHGLFTYTLILRSLDRLLGARLLNAEQTHHVLGRVAFYLHKFAIDLSNLNDRTLFTDQGLRFYYLFLQAYDYNHEHYFQRIKYIDLGNQPYVFSLSKFLAANPLPEATPIEFDSDNTAASMGGYAP